MELKTRLNQYPSRRCFILDCEREASYWSQWECKDGSPGSDAIDHCQAHREKGREKATRYIYMYALSLQKHMFNYFEALSTLKNSPVQYETLYMYPDGSGGIDDISGYTWGTFDKWFTEDCNPLTEVKRYLNDF